MTGFLKSKIIGLLLFLFLLAADLWTKEMARLYLKGRSELPVIKGVFVLQYLENRGAAFGILQGQRIFLIILTVLFIGGLGFAYLKLSGRPRLQLLLPAVIMLGAGAVGNMLDRTCRGYVVDFLYFKLINFPIFNVADCYIVISAFFSAIMIGFYYKEEDFKS